MSRWFRLYDELLDDPKVQRLSGEDFKAWVNILCLSSRNAGTLPPAKDIAFSLRLDVRKTTAMLERLKDAGLIDEVGGGLSPHKWGERQYKSDVSTDRVKAFRQRKKAVAGNGDETFPATPPDTDTEAEFQLPNGNCAKSDFVDPEKVMFDSGLKLLQGSGKSEGQARSLLGKWKRDHGAEAVIAGLGAAQREGAIDPAAYIEGRWREERRRKANDDEGFSIGGVRMNSPC
jgi:hypothetical protein